MAKPSKPSKPQRLKKPTAAELHEAARILRRGGDDAGARKAMEAARQAERA